MINNVFRIAVCCILFYRKYSNVLLQYFIFNHHLITLYRFSVTEIMIIVSTVLKEPVRRLGRESIVYCIMKDLVVVRIELLQSIAD